MRTQEWCVGIDEHAVPPGAEVVVMESANVGDAPFHAEKMMIWESMSGGTSVVSLLVNKVPQAGLSPDAEPVKSAFFATDALGNGFKFRCGAGQTIAISVRNDTLAEVKVGAVFFGKTGE